MTLTIIVPMLYEGPQIPALLEHIQSYAQEPIEWLIVDGGSEDGGPEQLLAAGLRVITAPRGRARQMNAGAVASCGEVLLFLHADSRLPSKLPDLSTLLTHSGKTWGRFDVCISGRSLWLKPIAWLMNWRSRLTGIATGDMGIFVTRQVFEQVGGFPDQALMEDIALSKRLRAQSPPLCLSCKITTSGRRWDERGVLNTVILMWRLRWLYWRGANPDQLAQQYQ